MEHKNYQTKQSYVTGLIYRYCSCGEVVQSFEENDMNMGNKHINKKEEIIDGEAIFMEDK